MPEAYGWLLVVTVRGFLVLERVPFCSNDRLQTLERRWHIFGKKGAGHRTAVSHHLDQSGRNIAEHRDVGVSWAGKSDQHGEILSTARAETSEPILQDSLNRPGYQARAPSSE